MTDIVMPRLSDTMEEGTILRWLKQDGDPVRRGEELVEIETDKANMTYESDRDGVLETVAREGDTLAVGELIAHIGEQAAAQAPGAGGPPGTNRDEQPASAGEGPVARQQPEVASQEAAPVRDASGNGAPPEQAGRVKASPLARRLAREAGVDLRSLSGSGPGGRIVKADVQSSASRTAPPGEPTEAPGEPPPAEPAGAPAAPSPGGPAAERARAAVPSAPLPGQPSGAPAPPSLRELAGAKGELTLVDPSRTQRTIARRMAESKATIPHFTLSADIDMQRCVELRAELKRLAQAGGAAPGGAAESGARHPDGRIAVPTYNDMTVKACALALREHPRANGGYRDGRFELHSRVNVGVAVAVSPDDALASALVVPTVFDADSKSLGEIARETSALAGRVREGTITPPELSGATFTVSNLGMYGVASFTAIVNPPQAAILAVGAVAPRAVVVTDGKAAQAGAGADSGTGRIEARHTMTVTLSCDHRILYGADAALFLARIRELLQEPAALAL